MQYGSVILSARVKHTISAGESLQHGGGLQYGSVTPSVWKRHTFSPEENVQYGSITPSTDMVERVQFASITSSLQIKICSTIQCYRNCSWGCIYLEK